MNSVKTAPPNSLVLIEDPSGGNVPASMAGSLVASTMSCIAVGCKSEADGETEFRLGAVGEVDPGNRPVFQGALETPTRKVSLRTVLGHTILEMPVAGKQTTVRVWANDPKEPDEIIVGVV
jgi:hypothetical protein